MSTMLLGIAKALLESTLKVGVPIMAFMKSRRVLCSIVYASLNVRFAFVTHLLRDEGEPHES
jgi:hypothetical protein